MGQGQPRLLDQVRDRIRRKDYSIGTEQYLRRLDPTLHIASQQATPRRHGGGGGRGVPHPPRGGETREGIEGWAFARDALSSRYDDPMSPRR